jgi:S1-C subfamily serine protease
MASADPMHVSGAEPGQGFRFLHKGRCYVVTAGHVVDGVPSISLKDSRGGSSTATPTADDRKNDLHFMDVGACPGAEEIFVGADIATADLETADLVVTNINSSGQPEKMTVDYAGSRTREASGQDQSRCTASTENMFYVTPRSKGATLQPGDSGAAVVRRSDGRVAGVIVCTMEGRAQAITYSTIKASFENSFRERLGTAGRTIALDVGVFESLTPAAVEKLRDIFKPVAEKHGLTVSDSASSDFRLVLGAKGGTFTLGNPAASSCLNPIRCVGTILSSAVGVNVEAYAEFRAAVVDTASSKEKGGVEHRGHNTLTVMDGRVQYRQNVPFGSYPPAEQAILFQVATEKYLTQFLSKNAEQLLKSSGL